MNKGDSFEFTAIFQPHDEFFEHMGVSLNPERAMRIVPKASRWFTVTWYPASWLSQNAVLQQANQQAGDDGMVTVTMGLEARDGFTRRRAEWWRWLGYYVIACPLDALEATLGRWRGEGEDWFEDDKDDDPAETPPR